ncbi:MAG: helix-turn-helix domain-containing protein [Muribaculaceae bacterium]|nr:helix-turn-helix domain-containing protein [Muribaculaceae bacterium]
MSEIQKVVGLRIRELRNKTGLSQEKFSLKIEMDRTYLASVEAGRRNISIINLEKIIKGFDVSFAEFFKDM